MSAHVLITGILLFSVVLVAHVLLWRVVRIKREIFWLFTIFLLCPLLLVVATVVGGYEGVKEAIAIALTQISLAVVYIQTYPALKSDIPTFRILLLLQQMHELTEEEILRQMDQAHLFDEKLIELESDSLIVQQDGKLVLSPLGKIIAMLFAYYRNLLGLKTGTG